jgi:hypothetical protein
VLACKRKVTSHLCYQRPPRTTVACCCMCCAGGGAVIVRPSRQPRGCRKHPSRDRIHQDFEPQAPSPHGKPLGHQRHWNAAQEWDSLSMIASPTACVVSYQQGLYRVQSCKVCVILFCIIEQILCGQGHRGNRAARLNCVTFIIFKVIHTCAQHGLHGASCTSTEVASDGLIDVVDRSIHGTHCDG